MKTTVKKWGINGEGIAFHEGKPVFIENAIPDEVIEFDIKSDEGTYLVGELTRLVEQSSSVATHFVQFGKSVVDVL